MLFKEEVSVIIPTYNGAQKVLALLNKLSNQTFKYFRVYIGIDGSADNTLEILESQTIFEKDKIIVYEQHNKGRASIRNKTASLAKGQVLIFLDDDVNPEKKLIEEHYKHHNKYVNSILGGAVFDNYCENLSDFLKFKNTLSKKWMENYKNQTQLLDKPNLFLTAANFSIPKQLFKKLNGFNEKLTDGEDWDLAVRAFKKEIDIYFDPTIKAYHINRITLKEDIIRQREYSKAHHSLRRINPNLYSDEYDRVGKPKLDYKRKIVYWLIARKYNVVLVDNFNIYYILSKKIRFSIYDIIRTGLGKIYINRSI